MRLSLLILVLAAPALTVSLAKARGLSRRKILQSTFLRTCFYPSKAENSNKINHLGSIGFIGTRIALMRHRSCHG